MKIQLSDHFTYKRLMKFVLPSICMMVFTSIYGVVDGYFISNFTGKTQFAAVNFIMPFIMLLATPGFMLGTGGSALISKTLGEGKREKANNLFSLFCFSAIFAGIIVMILSFFLMPVIAKLMGADGDLLYYSVLYGRVVIIGCVPQMLHFVFESFTVTAEKPTLGLKVTIVAGVTNIVLDFLLVGVFDLGIVGAAAATVISQCIGGFLPFIYFLRPNSSVFRIGRFSFDGKALIKASTNGLSELMSNISMSLIGMVYNVQLMKYLGENGIAAYGTIMYVNFIFIAIFIGYSIGTSPIIGFNFGAENRLEMRNILKKSILILTAFGGIMVILGELLAFPLSSIFVSFDKELLDLTVHGFKIFSLSFLPCGFAIFGSSFFTALNNGLISGIISFMRTLVFELLALILLPPVIGPDGLWFAVVVAEFASFLLSAVFAIAFRKKYGY